MRLRSHNPLWPRWALRFARALVVIGLLGSSGAAQQLFEIAAGGACCQDEACEQNGPGDIGVHACQTCSFCSHTSALPAPGVPAALHAGEHATALRLRALGLRLSEHRAPLIRPPAG